MQLIPDIRTSQNSYFGNIFAISRICIKQLKLILLQTDTLGLNKMILYQRNHYNHVHYKQSLLYLFVFHLITINCSFSQLSDCD